MGRGDAQTGDRTSTIKRVELDVPGGGRQPTSWRLETVQADARESVAGRRQPAASEGAKPIE